MYWDSCVSSFKLLVMHSTDRSKAVSNVCYIHQQCTSDLYVISNDIILIQ